MLRKFIKYGIIIFIAGVICVIGEYYGLKLFLNYKWKNEFVDKQVESIELEISNTPDLPNNFNKIVIAYYPYFDVSINEKYRDLITKEIIGNNRMPRRKYQHNRYFSERMFKLTNDSLTYSSHYIFNNNLVFAFGIENFTTPEKCKNYYYNNVKVNVKDSASTKRELVGINEVSEYLFHKPINELSDKEAIRVFIHTDIRKDLYYIGSDLMKIEMRLRVIKNIINMNKNKR